MNASNEKAYAIGFRIYNVNELLKNYKFMIRLSTGWNNNNWLTIISRFIKIIAKNIVIILSIQYENRPGKRS
jgi:hypothetical protein